MNNIPQPFARGLNTLYFKTKHNVSFSIDATKSTEQLVYAMFDMLPFVKDQNEASQLLCKQLDNKL